MGRGKGKHRASDPLDDLVADVYRAAGHDPFRPPGIGAIAKALRAPMRRHLAGLANEDAAVEIARAVASWWWTARHGIEPQTGIRDDLASRLLVPTPALVVAITILGLSAGEVAHMFVCPRKLAAARIRQVKASLRSGTRRMIP